MDAIAALYPSAAGNTNTTISPLADTAAPAPVAAPVAEVATVAPEAIEHAEVAQPIEQPETVAEPVLDSRPKIDSWFADARGTEPAAGSVTDYNAVTSYPKDVEPDTAERDLALAAFQKSGIGVTTASALWKVGMDAIRAPITTTSDAARASLQAQWGDKTDANLAIAKQQIDSIAKTWPGVRQMLGQTGLGNSVEFIQQLVNRAKR